MAESGIPLPGSAIQIISGVLTIVKFHLAQKKGKVAKCSKN
jgi:hypothetical protein